MDKKKRRKKKEEPVKSISPKPANHSRRPPFRPGICVCVSLCVCGSKTPGDTGMDLLTWTRKGKDSNIYYIYTYLIYILIGMLPKSQSLESLLVLFVTTTYYYCCYCLCVCVCVYPCKQFVVVTIRRTGSWNTIPTLPYLTLLTFFIGL